MDIRAVTTFTSNSDGLMYPSVSIYFSGCDKPIKCPDCHNPELQNPEYGSLTTTQAIIASVEKKLVGLFQTFPKIAVAYVGGEPLAPWNREAVLEISKHIKVRFGDKSPQILYSWRYIEDIMIQDLMRYMQYIDTAVLGPFEIENFEESMTPASSNQYIYDMKYSTKVPSFRRI